MSRGIDVKDIRNKEIESAVAMLNTVDSRSNKMKDKVVEKVKEVKMSVDEIILALKDIIKDGERKIGLKKVAKIKIAKATNNRGSNIEEIRDYFARVA